MPPTNHIAEHHSEGWASIQGAFWRGGGIAPDLELKDVLPKLTDEACAVIKSHAGRNSQARQPLLLYLALTPRHTPWRPNAEFSGQSGAGMYGDFAMMADAQIGRVLAELDEAHLANDTLVIFTCETDPSGIRLTWRASVILGLIIGAAWKRLVLVAEAGLGKEQSKIARLAIISRNPVKL